jgi:hypothetical protein
MYRPFRKGERVTDAVVIMITISTTIGTFNTPERSILRSRTKKHLFELELRLCGNHERKNGGG